MSYTLQFQKYTTLSVELAAAATSGTLASGVFGSPASEQLLVIDYDVPAKAEVVECAIAGTALTSMTRAMDGTTDQTHSAGANVAMCFVPTHYSDILSQVSGDTNTWVGVGEFILDNATHNVVDDVGFTQCIDGSSQGFSLNAIVPTGRTAISNIKIYYKNEAINTVVQIYAMVTVMTAGAVYTGNRDSANVGYSTTANNNYIETFTLDPSVTNGLTALAAGKIVNVQITRDGGNVADTYGVTWRVL